MDPATAGVLRDYQNALPSDARSGQLDFGSTPVAAPRWNQLVGQEGGDVGKFNSMVNEVGGPNPQVTQTPILLRSDKGEFGTGSLFQVKGPDGKTTLVDGQGAKYADMNDYLENNDLDDSWTMVRPANPGAPAGEQGQLISGPAHNTTFSQRIDKFGTQVAGPAMVVGGALMVGASAVGEVGTVGLATPVAAPTAAVGVGLVMSGSALIVNGTGKDLFNRYQHGRSIQLSDPQARADWLNLVGVAGGAGGMAARAAGRAATAAVGDSAAVGAFGAQTADQGKQLYNDWGSLTPQQRTERAVQLGANTALLAAPAAGRAAPGAASRSPKGGANSKPPDDVAPAEGAVPTVEGVPPGDKATQRAAPANESPLGSNDPAGVAPRPQTGPTSVEAGIPQGVTPEQFQQAGSALRKVVGDISDDVAVHGSRGAGTARPDSDIDIAIRVAPDKFDQVVRGRMGVPNPGSAKEDSLKYALSEGKFTAGRAGYRQVRDQLQEIFGRKVDLSIVRIGGNFDQGPYIQLPKG
ncbi:MAG TPA: DUF4781 domain-containing protein [Pseudonocardia sp.]|uniref:DUF4781 domain-containing protein n=1 Tax=Pseudonocardia sp. TaxID=60912 RepID=UPI002B8C3DF2|nr:DUF4781 domain-containing protein [Pseudonocardia sp.]HTF49074.1 DUF4781 domain-containing protein [Pseudonocardia sp.]